jgi:hypothetical protein
MCVYVSTFSFSNSFLPPVFSPMVERGVWDYISRIWTLLIAVQLNYCEKGLV